MADKNIMFKDAEGYLKATIDGETIDLNVKEIIKQNTFITINKDSLDTPLRNDIEFTGMIDTISDSMRDLLRSGILYITVQDKMFKTVIQTTVPFENRNFSVCLPNSLPIGDYYCKIEYLESKYFFGCQYTTQFKITKRPIGYKFDKSFYSGYPNETIEVEMYLYDYKTKEPIQTVVSYKFNDKEYMGKTNEYGYITMSLTIPDVIKENCKSFKGCKSEDEQETPEEDKHYYTMDTKGWVYQNGQLIRWFDSEYSYYVGDLGIQAIKVNNEEEELSDINEERYHILEIDVQNDSYITYPISVRIHVNKSPTTIFLQDKIKSIDDIRIRLVGYVEGMFSRAKYGAIKLTIEDEPIEYTFCLDDEGNFDYCFDPIDAMIKSSNDLENYIEGIGNTRKVIPQIDFEVDTQNVINTINGEYGKTYVFDVYNETFLKATAKMSQSINNKVVPITEGMVCFIIYRQRYDGVWVRNYRYSEEIDENGEAQIIFDLSADGNFYIYAIYYGMFEYDDVVSRKQYYNVINDSNTIKFNKQDALELGELDIQQEMYINDKDIYRLKLDIDNWYDADGNLIVTVPEDADFRYVGTGEHSKFFNARVTVVYKTKNIYY